MSVNTHWVYECRNPNDTVRIQRHVPFFSTSRDAAKYERLRTGLALYRLVFGQVNQEDLLDNLQRQVQEVESAEQDKVFTRLASYMLNLSPIGHQQALKYAEDEAEGLLRDYGDGGIEKLLQAVTRTRVDRLVDLSEVGDELERLVRFVQEALIAGDTGSTALKKAVSALAYLRNPYDHVFDLHVEGGFADDIDVIRQAVASLPQTANQRR